MNTQDITFLTIYVGQAFRGHYRLQLIPILFLFGPGRLEQPQPLVDNIRYGHSKHCGQVSPGNKPYTHVKNEFRESICSCTGTLPIHEVKFTQRASGSTGTPALLPATQVAAVRPRKSIHSCNGTGDYRAERFLRNRNQIKFRDHQGSNHSALLAWLKPTLAKSRAIGKTRARATTGEVVSRKIREILLRRLKGFSTKKFT